MTLLRTLRKLLLGETWILPLGIAILVAAAFGLRAVDRGGWSDAGGLVLLAGVVAVLVLSVASSARPKR